MKTPLVVALGAFMALSLVPVANAQGAIRPGKIRVAAAPASSAEVAAAAPSAELSEAELAMAKNVYTGDISCNQGADVVIAADDANAGYFNVRAGDRNYHMRPVISRTGATRLEDTQAGAMWLQLGNKSMLLDQKLGRRVADGCAGSAQLEFAAEMKNKPATNLLHMDGN